MDMNIGAAIVEVCHWPDNMGDADMKRSVAAVAAFLLNPDVEQITCCVGGLDDDPREVWEVPEVMAYLKRWGEMMAFVAITHGIPPERGKQALNEEFLLIIAAALDPEHITIKTEPVDSKPS